MWSCVKNRKRLGAYLDGELSRREQESVERHLQRCDSCRLALSGLKKLEPALTAFDVPPVPSWLTARVMAAARNRQREVIAADWSPLKWWRIASAPIQAAAIGMLIVGLSLGLVLGWTSAPSSKQVTVTAQPDPLDIYQLDYLSDLPSGSIASSYMTLIAATNEAGR